MVKYLYPVIFGLLLSKSAISQDSLGVSRVGRNHPYRDWSEVEKVLVQGNYSYIIGSMPNLDDGIYIQDISDASLPLEVGGFMRKGMQFDDIALQGDYLFASGVVPFPPESFMLSLDISDPRSPELVNYYEGYNITALTIYGHFLYLASYDYRLLVWDISDPLEPRQIGSCETSFHKSYHLRVFGDNLLMVSSGIAFIDISNPETPSELGVFSSEEPVYDAQLVGGYLYLAEQDGLFVLDITDLASPDTIWQSENNDRTAYREMALGNDYIYITRALSGVHTYDISEPNAPVLADSANREGYNYIAFQGDYLFTNGYNDALYVLSIADPAHPIEVGWFKPPIDSRSLSLNGDYAYVTDYYFGLRVVDISDPIHPYDVTYTHIRNPRLARARHSLINGDYAILGTTKGFEIFDISSPTDLQFLGRFTGQYPLSSLKSAMLGEHLIHLSTSSLSVWDISNPSTPTRISIVSLPDARDMVIQDSLAYVSTDSSIATVDLSDPSSPEILGRFALYSGHEGIAIYGNHLYSAVGDYGIIIYDISAPLIPRPDCQFFTPGNALRVDVASDLVFVADSAFGLRVVDITDLGNPREIGYYYDSYYTERGGRVWYSSTAMDLVLNGSKVFVANDRYFDIFDCSGIMSAPSIFPTGHPSSFILSAFPNPFNDRLNININIPRPGPMTLEVYDPFGRRLKTLIPGSNFSAGSQQLMWNASGLPAGTYLLRLESPMLSASRIATLVR